MPNLTSESRSQTEKMRWTRTSTIVPVRPATSIAFSPDDRLLASGGGQESEVVIWEVAGSSQLCMLRGHAKRIWCLVFSPDGRWLVTGSADSTVRIWDMSEAKTSHILQAHRGTVEALCIIPNENLLTSGGIDGTIRFWDLQHGAHLRVINQDSAVTSISVSPDERFIATGALDRTVRLWNVLDGRLVHKWEIRVGLLDPIGAGWIRNVIFLDNQILLTGHDQKHFNLWNIHSLQHIATIESTGNTQDLALSADRRTLAQIDSKGKVSLWDTASWKRTELSPKHRVPFIDKGRSVVAFSHDGARMASAGRTNEIFLWNRG